MNVKEKYIGLSLWYESVMPPPMQGKCDKQAYSIEELKMALSEMATRNEELSAQCDAEKESCRLMEVPQSYIHIYIYILSCPKTQ